jgi:hypothetical protein
MAYTPPLPWRSSAEGATLRAGAMKADDTRLVTCPYCGEEIEIYVEPDVHGSYVQDCEVCCNPWTIRVSREDGELYVDVSRADGSE